MRECFYSTFAILFIVAYAGVPCDKKCPSGWLTNNGSCYWIEKTTVVTFCEAKSKCQEKGASIFVPKSISEYNTVMASTSSSSFDYTWIGLSHKCNSTPKWDQNSTLNYKELNWPVKSQDDGTRCAASQKKDNLLHTYWMPCDNKNYFVCEGNIEAVAKQYEQQQKTTTTSRRPTTTVRRLEKCEDGWIRFEDSCYLVSREHKASYSRAKRRCEYEDADIFTPNSMRECRTIMGNTKVFAHTWTGLDSDRRWASPTTFDYVDMNWLIKPFSSAANGYVYHPSYCAAYYNGNIDTSKFVYFYPCDWEYNYICDKSAYVEVTEPPRYERPRGAYTHPPSCSIL